MSTIVPVERVRPVGRVRSIRPRRSHGAPSVIVVGDLTLDVVLLPARALEMATDVPGRVMLRQGGSAATTARWVARLGARSTLLTAVGRDPVGRALVARLRRDRVSVRAVRAFGPSGRIGVLVMPDGERSFVADRGASDLLAPGDLREGWFSAVDGVHLPAYSLLGEPLGLAGRRAVELGRAAGARISVDLASSGPLLAGGRAEAVALISSIGPDLLFATESESAALLGHADPAGLLDLAPIAIVKRGGHGATIVVRPSEPGGTPLRLEVATRQVVVADTTGAGDAFDAGFLVAWLSADAADRHGPATLRRSVVAGHRAATRQLSRPPEELDFD